MIESEFCEKEFEILFCREFLNKYNCDFYFPSQRKEVRKGFDARFKNKIFKAKIYQFKIVSEYVKNPFGHALQAYGFKTHKGKNDSQTQHNKLVYLNQKGLDASYLVPKFIKRNSLITFSRNLLLLHNCVSLKPLYSLPAGNHYIKFDAIKAQQFCQEAENMEISCSFSVDDGPEISYNDLFMPAKLNEQGSLFDVLSKHNLIMMYKMLT